MWSDEHDSLDAAAKLDQKDPLHPLRKEFVFPRTDQGKPPLYFAGHSLGLMPVRARAFVEKDMDVWGSLAVDGHHQGEHPWLPYHEEVTSSLAALVGAKHTEVVAMNSLTVNLHLLLVSFYRPTRQRHKILIENNPFPSDKYAVDSQARYHGLDPGDSVVELKPEPGKFTIAPEQVQAQIAELGDSLALVLLGNCNYLSGQCFDFEQAVTSAHQAGALIGFNLAHGVGNLALKLHDWEADFAVWCSYKYLNAGPGAIAGAFVHEKHVHQEKTPRFEGWWGHNKQDRFKMGPHFEAIPSVEAWQLSNPPILQLACLRAALSVFDKTTMQELRQKGDRLTSYFEWLLTRHLEGVFEVVTPKAPQRGSMLCTRFRGDPRHWANPLREQGVFLDFREPDILRATPAPIYNSFKDVYRLVQVLAELADAS